MRTIQWTRIGVVYIACALPLVALSQGGVQPPSRGGGDPPAGGQRPVRFKAGAELADRVRRAAPPGSAPGGPSASPPAPATPPPPASRQTQGATFGERANARAAAGGAASSWYRNRTAASIVARGKPPRELEEYVIELQDRPRPVMVLGEAPPHVIERLRAAGGALAQFERTGHTMLGDGTWLVAGGQRQRARLTVRTPGTSGQRSRRWALWALDGTRVADGIVGTNGTARLQFGTLAPGVYELVLPQLDNGEEGEYCWEYLPLLEAPMPAEIPLTEPPPLCVPPPPGIVPVITVEVVPPTAFTVVGATRR